MATGARRVEPVLAQAVDYADAFEISVRPGDVRSARELMHRGLAEAPAAVRAIISVAHRGLLRLRLGPSRDESLILGWRIAAETEHQVRLEAEGPLVRAAIIGQRPEPGLVRLTTTLDFRSSRARWLWAVVGPVHRLLAPVLLKRATSVGQTAGGLDR